MHKTIDIILASGFLVSGLGLLAMTFGDAFEVRTFGGDVGPAFAPRLFLVAWSIFAAITLAQALMGQAAKPAEDMETVRTRQFLVVIVVAAVTALAMTRIGFVFATIPGLAAFCWAFGYRKPVPLALVSLLVPLGIWALFTFGFELLLPRSPWFHQI